MFLLSLIPPPVLLAHALGMWRGGKQGAGRTERGFWWFPSPGVLKKNYPFLSRFVLAVFWLNFLEINALVLSHHKNTWGSEDSEAALRNIFLFPSIYHTDLFSSLSRSVIKIQSESSPFLEKGYQIILFFFLQVLPFAAAVSDLQTTCNDYIFLCCFGDGAVFPHLTCAAKLQLKRQQDECVDEDKKGRFPVNTHFYCSHANRLF